MDFRLDEEQLALRETVRRFCASRFALDRMAEREARGVDRTTWREMGELGFFSSLAPEARGGLGLGVIEAAVIFEQLGAHLAEGPVLWSALAAPIVVGAADGSRMVGGVEHGFTEDEAVLVEHAEQIDSLLILRPDGAFVCERDELPAAESLAPFDPLTPVGRFAALPSGARVGDTDVASRLRLVATALASAMLLGISETALEASRRYALDREQFGVPIGSFQAIQHLLADMYVRTELARSATYAAAAVLDDPEVGDAARACAGAKLLAGEAALENARTAIQVHGGMGFTWEMLPHYLMKRAWVLENSFGDADGHALALGASLEETLA